MLELLHNEVLRLLKWYLVWQKRTEGLLLLLCGSHRDKQNVLFIFGSSQRMKRLSSFLEMWLLLSSRSTDPGISLLVPSRSGRSCWRMASFMCSWGTLPGEAGVWLLWHLWSPDSLWKCAGFSWCICLLSLCCHLGEWQGAESFLSTHRERSLGAEQGRWVPCHCVSSVTQKHQNLVYWHF